LAAPLPAPAPLFVPTPAAPRQAQLRSGTARTVRRQIDGGFAEAGLARDCSTVGPRSWSRHGCRLRSRPIESARGRHAAEPEVSSAIEGGKIPGRAPNHYSRLAGSVDAMELYDLGDNVETVRSLNPRLMMLLTSVGARHFTEWRITLVQADVRGLSSRDACRDRRGSSQCH